ncbi:MAG: zinc ribbon domain-containing protein [Candidatus Omnitrophota bacterium]|nr:MAG: zinc ribbon domain-containing protein [Candidatus Omnitrophota bacterium]
MPTYEYECTKCKHKFEAFQNITEKPLIRCPKCRHALRRLFGSGAGIIFKGIGFYATDYKKKPAIAKQEKEACKTCPEAGKVGCEAKKE